jgi:mannose-6-phosphate isomerase-like protein (cupin superfamily)
LTLTLKVDSSRAPATTLLAGVGELRGDEGVGRHRTADEVILVTRGWGHAMIGADTARLGPGSVLYVPPGTPHRLVSTGAPPLTYFFALGPASSAAGFRQAAQLGCPGAPAGVGGAAAGSSGAGGPVPAPLAAAAGSARSVTLDPGEGERITYCAFPLTITAKVDTNAAPGARLMAATGALRRGTEAATHPGLDEIVFVTHGRGRAFTGSDTAAIEPGSVVFTPKGVPHGLINDGAGTLEYLVLFGGAGSRAGYRRLAAQPGPHCPAGGP